MARADAAFDVLADPLRLPEYVPTMTLVDSIAIDGQADADADLPERDGAPDAGFVADRRTRTISWGRPGSDYGGSIAIRESTASTSDVTLTLRTRADADAEAVARLVDGAVSSMRRMLTGLR